MKKSDLQKIEKILGRRFKNQSLLVRALTHSSLSGDNSANDLERLEFLGDRVLGLLTAEKLWKVYPHYNEGELAPRFNALVRKETCAKAALHFGIEKYIQMSSWEAQSGGRKKKAILGDVMEALLGALYIDGGMRAARNLYDAFWTPNLESLSKYHRDAKTALQEWTQQNKRGVPEYVVVTSQGPAHAPAFVIEVRIKGLKSARGEGRSKRSAQMKAAQAILVREGVWKDGR